MDPDVLLAIYFGYFAVSALSLVFFFLAAVNREFTNNIGIIFGSMFMLAGGILGFALGPHAAPLVIIAFGVGALISALLLEVEP